MHITFLIKVAIIEQTKDTGLVPGQRLVTLVRHSASVLPHVFVDRAYGCHPPASRGPPHDLDQGHVCLVHLPDRFCQFVCLFCGYQSGLCVSWVEVSRVSLELWFSANQ